MSLLVSNSLSVDRADMCYINKPKNTHFYKKTQNYESTQET